MTNRGITAAIIIVAVLVVGALAYWYYNNNSSSTQSYNQNGPQGTLILGVKDAAVNMGAISSVMATVSKVEIHSAGQGWVTVSNNTQQYDLLALKNSGTVALLAKADINADTYDQVRLTVDKIVVVENGVQKEAKLPSGELKMNVTSTVSENNTSTAVFDVLADKSLHLTGSGKYIFTPVIQVETRQNATASVDTNNAVSISNGTVQTNGTVAMDVTGEMKNNFTLSANTTLEVTGNIIQVTTPTGGAASSAKVNASTAAQAAVNGGFLDTAISATLTKENNVKVWQVSGMKGLELTNVMVDAATGAVITGNAGAQTQSSSPSSTQGQSGQGQTSGGSANVGGSGGVQVQY